MNLEKASDDEKVAICRKYFIGGFFFLPFLWVINSVWFFKQAIKKNGNQMIRRYVAGSILGTIVWIAVIVTWTSIYQTTRSGWGAFGDYISLTVPFGSR